MNAKYLLDQIMKQASGSSGSRSGSSGGLNVQGLINTVSSQLSGTGKSGKGGKGGSSSGGLDVKSLMGGGALGMLMGSSRGRSMGGKAAKYAALAGVGMMAWKAWQKYQGGSPSRSATAAEGQPLEELQGKAQEQRSLEVLQAVIWAARADGHIDADERALITEQIQGLGADDELHAWVEKQLEAPLDAQALASQADSPQAAREIYLTSAAVIDEQNAMERAWLDELGAALGLEEGVRQELEKQLPSN